MPRPPLDADNSWFKHLFELSPDPTWIIENNHFVECNDAAVRTLGYADREALMNVHPSRLSPARQPDGQTSFAKAERMMKMAKAKGLHRFEWTHTKANGSEFVAEVTLSSIELDGRQVIYCVWRDITERKLMEEQIRVLAFHDQLTGLPNRRLLNDRLGQALAAGKRSGYFGALMLLDLDNFKPLNDAHGHAAGDMLLVEVAHRLKACVRDMDTVARFGGDEFVIMLAELSTDRGRIRLAGRKHSGKNPRLAVRTLPADHQAPREAFGRRRTPLHGEHRRDAVPRPYGTSGRCHQTGRCCHVRCQGVRTKCDPLRAVTARMGRGTREDSLHILAPDVATGLPMRQSTHR